MNAQTFHIKTGWRQRGRGCNSSLRAGQRRIHVSIWKFSPPAIGCCDAIQHSEQRPVAGIVQAHERKARLDFARYAGQIHSGVVGQMPALQNGTRKASKPCELVRNYVGSTRPNKRHGDYRARFSTWRLCPLATSEKKRVVLYGNRINSRLIDTVFVLWATSVDTVSVLIRGFFDHSPSTISVHPLDIPLLQGISWGVPS